MDRYKVSLCFKIIKFKKLNGGCKDLRLSVTPTLITPLFQRIYCSKETKLLNSSRVNLYRTLELFTRDKKYRRDYGRKESDKCVLT